jgi:uncharacterized membrane protein YidH (DUF202 family)
MENPSHRSSQTARHSGLILLIILAVALAALLIWRFYIALAIVKLIFTIVFAPIRYGIPLFGGGNH